MSTEGRRIELGNTRTPLRSKLVTPNGKPVDLAGLTVKFQMWNAADTAVIAETDSHVTVHPTTTFTADAANEWLVANDHLIEHGDQIVVSTTDTLPSGLAASTRYFARDCTPNNFRLAATPDGPVIALASAGTGTHSFYIVGSVQYAWQTADVGTAGRFKCWWTVYTGTDFDTFPCETDQDLADGIVVTIQAAS